MEAYRDQYAELFREGRGVTVIGISNDPPDELASWARDAEFPFLFASDSAGTTAHSFGTGLRANLMIDKRTVMVVDPEGRISHIMYPFREIDPTAYEELRDAVAAVAPPLDEMEGEEGGGGAPDGLANAARTSQNADEALGTLLACAL